ncbi:NAD(P)H-quinone oxidoreductase subunit 2, chloroplastic [subsurface metagenome]
MDLNLLFVPVFLPLAVGIVIFIIPRAVRVLPALLSLLTAAAVFAAAVLIFFKGSADFHFPLFEIGKFTLSFDLLVTPLSSFILIFVGGFGFLISLYSLFYMMGKARLKEYYGFFLLALAGSGGVLMADHFIIFLIFWEIVTASLYFLITTGDPEAKVGATKTFATLGLGDGCLLLGIGILWYLGKSFTISSLHITVQGALPWIAFILMMVGAITKAGAMPFHSWIPAASEGAPAPVMALLPAAIDKLLGIYLLVRMFTGIFILGSGAGLLLMIIGAVTIVAAVMVAMVQHDLRRLLSYHAVSQVGYMLLGIGTMTPLGLAGGLFHMLNNSIYKNCLFLCTGAVEKKTGSTDLGRLGGLARVMPITFAACLIAALAISGVPPLNGFVSKWMIYQGVIKTGTPYSFIFLIAAMFGSALTLASFIKVIYSVFLGPKSDQTLSVKQGVGFGMQFPMIILSLLCLVFGIYYLFPLNAFILPGLGVAAEPLGLWSSVPATGLIVIGLLAGLLIYLLGKYKKSARVVGAFTGGEELDRKTGRIIGTHFYDTIKTMPLLKNIYRAQGKGHLDPYSWMGGLGLSFTGFLKRVHNGLLSWYLSWSLLGIVILAVIFILFQ